MQSDLPNFKSGVQGGTPTCRAICPILSLACRGVPPLAGKENCVDRCASCNFCVFYIEMIRYISIHASCSCS